MGPSSRRSNRAEAALRWQALGRVERPEHRGSSGPARWTCGGRSTFRIANRKNRERLEPMEMGDAERLGGRVKKSILIALLLATSGCASLHIRPSDSVGVAVAKGVARVPVGVITLGISELWHSRERAVSSWVGHRESELLLAWGRPNESFGDGRGGRILVYTELRTFVSPGVSTTRGSGTGHAYASGNQIYARTQWNSTTTYVPPTIHHQQVYRQFLVDSSGVVVGYSWRGL